MSEKLEKLKAWMDAASVAEQLVLAKAACTSRAHLRHLSSGRRLMSADLAGRIEAAAEVLRLGSGGRLPKLHRAQLCVACSKCPLAKAALQKICK